MRIAALDLEASGFGLKLGQSLSDARALVPSMDVREIDRPLLEAIFADFADWHSYASPMVSVLTDTAPYGDLALDITGVSHLFGGETAMLERVLGKIWSLGYSAIGSVAPTIGSAWALVHCNEQCIVTGSIAEAIAPLPVSALRLDEQQIADLNQTGLKTIGQLYGRDRKALQARFGVALLLRLDQALGYVEERMAPRLPLVERFAEHRFADPIGLIDDVLMCASDLAVSLAHQLEAEGSGAKTFHLFLYRVDHKVINFSVNAGRATRDPYHIARLFKHRAERLAGDYDAGFGIDIVRLAASSVFELGSVQIGAFEIDNGAHDLEQLYDRMTSRLGPLAVLRPKPVDTHIPEQAVRLEPIVARSDEAISGAFDITVPRPLRLLPQPELVSVVAQIPDGPPARMTWRRVGYRFVKASDAERISSEWWAGNQLPILTKATEDAARLDGKPDRYYDEARAVRDYYIAEDEEGRRYWLFREGLYGHSLTPAWYIHGLFA
ncbi:MAG: DNA polymerase Y family protein [Hyphomicrobiales bacterium]|nr:MAG: DNA polymerase Y family protein [Hyphomicrobiales bacterium]